VTDPLQTLPDDGEAIPNPLGGPLTIKAHGHETGDALSAFLSTPAPGEGPPLHVHAEEDELMYFLEGSFRTKLDGTVREAPAGSMIFIPKGAPHAWQNVGDEDGRVLFVFTPASPGMEEFFRRFADQSKDAFSALADEAGMEILGPPMAESDPLV
jgi:quercetin dioxygenase-like cupin family protein